MAEAQALIALPYLLRDPARRQHRVAKGAATSLSKGISTWPEAIQYLLRMYATPAAIREAVLTARNIRQHDNENEVDCSTRLCQAIARCGMLSRQPNKLTCSSTVSSLLCALLSPDIVRVVHEMMYIFWRLYITHAMRVMPIVLEGGAGHRKAHRGRYPPS